VSYSQHHISKRRGSLSSHQPHARNATHEHNTQTHTHLIRRLCIVIQQRCACLTHNTTFQNVAAHYQSNRPHARNEHLICRLCIVIQQRARVSYSQHHISKRRGSLSIPPTSRTQRNARTQHTHTHTHTPNPSSVHSYSTTARVSYS